MNPNYRAAWALAAIAIVAPVGYYFWSAAQNLPPAEAITVAFAGFAGDAPTLIAYTQGFFREEGLEVTLERKRTGVQSLTSLLEGRVDIATVSEFPVVRVALEESRHAPATGARFLVIGDVIYSNRSQRVIVRSDRNIRTAADLKGRRVGIPVGNTSVDYYLGNMLRQHGIADADLKVLQLEISSLAAALERGDIDAFIAWEPFIAETKARLGEGAFVFPGNPLYSTSGLILVAEDFAKRKPKLLPKFLRAIKKSEGFIHEHPEEAVTAVATHAGVDRQIVARTWKSLDFRLSLSPQG